MARATVSVIVPTYYRNDRLRQAIRSAYDQAWPVEVIVVDGSGERHAEPVVAAFRDRGVTYIAQEEDRGPHAARNIGFRAADGEYIQFLDDDDRLLDRKLAVQVPLLSDSVRVVYSGLIDEDWGVVSPRDAVRGDVLAETLELRTFPCIPSTMLIDRSLVDDLCPFEQRHGADDSGMKIELARRTRFEYVDEPLVVRGKPETARSASWAHIRGRKHLLERYDHLYERFPDRVRRRAVRRTHYRAGNKYLEEARWTPRAILAFAKAFYHTPDARAAFLAAVIASVFGRPGLDAVDRVYQLP